MPTNPPAKIRLLSEPIQYRPGQPRDRETSKLIRSHVVGHARREKREQLLNSLSQRLREKVAVDGQFCSCLITHQPSTSAGSKDLRGSSRALQKQQAIADGYKICLQCRRCQFTELSWTGQLKMAKACLPTVTPFLEAEFDPFQSLPELSNLKGSESTRRDLNELKAHILIFWSYDTLRSQVLPIAAKEPALFMALLYSSCAHLNAMRNRGETALSMAIKAESIRQIQHRLDDPNKRNTTLTVASIGYMCSGVCAFRSPSAVQEVQAHEDAMLHVFSQGMDWTVPDGDLLGATHEFTRSATLGMPLGPEWVVTFCQSNRVMSDSEFVLESPLYCPREDFHSVRKHPKCSVQTLQVLRGMRYLIDAVLDPNSATDAEYASVRAGLVALPSVTTAVGNVSRDYIFESCRLASMIMITALDTGTPFVDLSDSLGEELKLALQKTDIGSYWGFMLGVLFWVAMVGSATTFGKPQHSFMNSVLVRGDHELTYRNSIFEAATLAAYKFQRLHLQIILGEPQPDLLSQLPL